MSAGVSDQRMKGQGNQVTNVPKDQHLESGGEELPEASWRHQQQSYAPPISSAADPYNAAGYYGTTALPYQAFGVGDGTWSTNGTDPMTFLGGYNPHDSYGMDGVFGPSTTQFSTAAFGQPASNFNYFHGNGDFSTWGQLGRAKQYDDYYRADGLYVPDGGGVKAVESGVQALSINEHKMEKDRMLDFKESSSGLQPKKMTWASIASQPAKPTPLLQSGGLKKKGPGMPPPPIVPGKHNMDIGTWDTSKSPPPMVVQSPPPPPLQMQQQPPQAQPQLAQQPPPPQLQPQPQPLPQPLTMTHSVSMQHRGPPPPVSSRPPPLHTAPPPAWTPRAPPPHHVAPPAPLPAPLPPQPPAPLHVPPNPNPILDELRVNNEYNPKDFDLTAPMARFFVIKSYSEDDIHRSIKYEIWCSTEHGNKRLDSAFREREREGGMVYLFFSVNGSGHFCGMARMMSAVDYNSNSSVWAQDKWKGQFGVKWIYVKDVPNAQLRYIRLENNENKPVTNSRDTQEVPHPKGLQVLRIMHSYTHSTSIFDDFIHYERRQEEEEVRKVPVLPENNGREDQEQGGRGYRNNCDQREQQREPRDYREPRDNRDPRDHRDQRDHREPRDYREPRDNREQPRDQRDHRDHREPREQRDHREPRDYRDHRDHRDNRNPYRDHNNRDNRELGDPREHRDNRDHREPRDERDHVYRDRGDRDNNYRPNHNKDRDGSRGRGRSPRN